MSELEFVVDAAFGAKNVIDNFENPMIDLIRSIKLAIRNEIENFLA